MGFLARLFCRKKTEYSDADYKEPDLSGIEEKKRERISLKDAYARERFVENCLEQIKEASGEIDAYEAEYDEVTSKLMDMEEIDNLSSQDRKNVTAIAQNLIELRKEHDNYVCLETKISQDDYLKMERIEDRFDEVLRKLEAQEEYQGRIKQDLLRIDRERSAYDYRNNELTGDIASIREISFIITGSCVVLLGLLAVMKFAFKLNVIVGLYITVFLTAVALTFIYIKYLDFVREKKRVNNASNELILLNNKVKIRYVNNKHLLDYLYSKYGVEKASQLKSLYEQFVAERELRRKFEKNEFAYREESVKLITLLQKNNIKDANIWLHQYEALVNSRDMVEIRHKLISRRQKLRKQMEYNRNIANDASDEVREVIDNYPESAQSILKMIEIMESEGKIRQDG